MKYVIEIPDKIFETIQSDEFISREQLAALQMHILNGMPIPNNVTNGDMVKAMFNPYKICEYEYNVHVYMTEEDFWKAYY